MPAADYPTPSEECPACGVTESKDLFRATDRLYRTTLTEFQIVECARCRLIRVSPRPSPRDLRFFYPENYWFVPGENAVSRLEEWYRRLVARDHVRFVERALDDSSEQGPVLDVGCGGGLFLGMLQERGRRVIGLDFAIDAAASASRQHSVPAVCGSLSDPPLPEGSCAAVTMFHVLEHLYDPTCYLASAHRLLKRDGRLIVQVPNASCWQFLLLGELWSGLDVPRHLHDFRELDLECLLDACGFEVIRRKHFSLRDNPAGLATSLAPGLDPMARRIRGVLESPRQQLFKDLVYLAMVVAAIPLTMIEAACHAGSTIMMEARKKP